MVRIDARLAIGGTIMIIAGIALSIHLESTTPVGMHGMTNEEIDDLLFEQRISGDIGNLVERAWTDVTYPIPKLPPLRSITIWHVRTCVNRHCGHVKLVV